MGGGGTSNVISPYNFETHLESFIEHDVSIIHDEIQLNKQL